MNTESIAAIFPQGDKAPADYFVGSVWIKMLVPNDQIFNTDW